MGGEAALFSDESENGLVFLLVGLLHGFTYVALALALWVNRDRIDAGSKVRTFLRSALMASFALMAAYFLPITPYVFVTDGDPEKVSGLAILAVSLGFAGMFVFAVALGLAMLRLPDQRLAAALLVAVLPAIGLVFVLDAFASDFAHPGYPEALVYLGTLAACTARQRSDARALSPA